MDVNCAAFEIANEGRGEGEDEEYSWGDISGQKIVDCSKSISL